MNLKCIVTMKGARFKRIYIYIYMYISIYISHISPIHKGMCVCVCIYILLNLALSLYTHNYSIYKTFRKR